MTYLIVMLFVLGVAAFGYDFCVLLASGRIPKLRWLPGIWMVGTAFVLAIVLEIFVALFWQ